MSKKIGSIGRHKFHGDTERFQIVADYIVENYYGKVKRIADVAGGQGMLSRILQKKYNFECEVIDPRGHTIVGIKNRKEKYTADMADYYDLIVSLHPDQALQEVVLSALIRPVFVVPGSNFWDTSKRLGLPALIVELETFYNKHGISHHRVELEFKGSHNTALVSEPPQSVSLDDPIST